MSLANPGKTKESMDDISMIRNNSGRCSLHVVAFITLKMPKLAGLGLYLSWGCIFSKSVFDWGCIIFLMGWGFIQEWGCICVDTVCKKLSILLSFFLRIWSGSHAIMYTNVYQINLAKISCAKSMHEFLYNFLDNNRGV